MPKSILIANGQLIRGTAAQRSVKVSENADDATIAVTINIPSTAFTKTDGEGEPPLGFISLDLDSEISEDIPQINLTSTGTSEIFLNLRVKLTAKKVNNSA